MITVLADHFEDEDQMLKVTYVIYGKI